MNPADLERAVDRQLRTLPPPRAPRTLLPRVMASVQAWSRQPWYARAWVTWPAGWQVTSAAVLVLLVAAAAVLVPTAVAGMADSTWPRFGRLASYVTSIVQQIEVVATAAQVIWRTLLAPLAPYAFVVAVLMWLSCVALGAALTRVVPREVVPR